MFLDFKILSIIFVLEIVEFVNYWNLLVLVFFLEFNIFYMLRNIYF